MAITKQKKEEILQELIDKFTRSQSVVFADYRGLDVASISDLRNKLREGDAEMKVAKKTLMALAAKDQKIDNLDETGMEGPVAATFSYEDPLAGIKILFNFSKQNDNLKLLGGIIDGKVVGPEIIEQYAKLPGREELLAKLMGSINAPVTGFVGILNGVISGFVRVVSSYKDTLPQDIPQDITEPAGEAKESEVPAEPKKEEPKTEEKPAEPATEAPSDDTVEEEPKAEEKPEPIQEAAPESETPDAEKTESTEDKSDETNETNEAEEVAEAPIEEETPATDEDEKEA